jgi:hypothetical protein
MNGIFHYSIGRTPQVEGHDMVGGVLSKFPSNLGMSEGSFVGIFDQVGSCNMGSFFSLVRLGILSEAKKGMIGVGPAMLWEEVVPWELVLCEKFGLTSLWWRVCL